jgi:N-acetylglucosamine-6-sulfatase
MTLTHDLAPSLLDLCGARALKDITGLSWKPLLEGRTVQWRDAFLYEYNYEKQFPYTPNVRAIRTEEWKFIRYPSGDGGPDNYTAELYDLRNDPMEMRNLANDAAHNVRRKALQERLEALSREAGPDSIPLDEGISNVAPKY